MTEKPDFIYIKGVQGGFDPETDRWRLMSGQWATRADILGEIDPLDTYGDYVTEASWSPMSDALDRFEKIILGGLEYDRLMRRAQQIREEDKHADFMPPEIRACMQLSEYYINSEGDLWNTVIVPIQMSLRDIEVESSDKGVQRELEEIYERIQLNEVLEWLWLCSEIYGNAYPLEVWNKDKGGDLEGIVLLNPKYMKVGQQISLLPRLSLAPREGQEWGGEEWSEEALAKQIHPMVYHSFASGWNEQVEIGNDIPLHPARCRPVTQFKFPWQRYAIPPLSRCFRPISTRQIAEEMQRATMEGFRNQLWHFAVGTDEVPAGPQELSWLRGIVSDKMRGQRTGYLVTRHTVNVKVIAPEAIDGLLGNEFWLAQTLHIYRQRGLSLKIITGESPGQRGTDIEWDIEVFMERMKHSRRSILQWEQHLRRSITAAKTGKAWKKAMENTRTYMLLPDLQTKTLVRDQLQPLSMMGLLSTHTMLQKLGFKYETELARKKEEESDAHYFMAQPSFAQSAVPAEGKPTTTYEQTPGRPPGTKETEPREEKVKASIRFEADANFDAFVHDAYDAFDALIESPSGDSADLFVEQLQLINSRHMMEFAKDGYIAGGGAYEVDPSWIRGSINYVNSYARDFGGRLKDTIRNDEALEDHRWNVYLYPQEGRHLAYMWGMQQAMKERGARSWRRVLHPERSETGPCDLCIADSAILHPIDEGFFEFHPNGVCTAQGVIYYTSLVKPIAEIPVPTKITLPKMIRELITKLGRIGKSIVRRIRTEL